MTPQQRIEEFKLLFENLDYNGFTTQDYLTFLEELDKAKAVVNKRIMEEHH